MYRRGISVTLGFFLALPVSFFGTESRAQVVGTEDNSRPTPVDRGAAGIWQALKKLHSRASVLMVTAHPDDEDGAMLAYEGRGEGARTALLTLNRGEGGANVMSSDYWDALGLVRTEELLQAGRYYGINEQFFTRVADYGFSKTIAEAFQKWPRDKVFYDAVRVVRITRPLVICSVFVGGPSDGHGNHAAAGEIAQELFKAAGDPNVFPDQIKAGLRPWNPLKEYGRVPFSLEVGHVSPKGLYDYATHHWDRAGVQNYITGKFEPGGVSANISIPIGNYDELLGLGYNQVSHEGLGNQKSQNGGPSIPSSGPRDSAYHRFGSRVEAKDKEGSIFDGIDVSVLGIAELAHGEQHDFLTSGLRQINQSVEDAIAKFSPQQPGAIATNLAAGLKKTAQLIDTVRQSSLSDEAKYDILHELTIKQQQFNEVLTLVLGLSLEADVQPAHPLTGPFAEFMGAQPSFQMATPGKTFSVRVHLADGGKLPVEIEAVQLTSPYSSSWKPELLGELPHHLEAGSATNVNFTTTVPADLPYTRPYFNRPTIQQPYYDIQDVQYLSLPLSPYPLSAKLQVSFDGVSLQLEKMVQVVDTIVGEGTVRNPMPVGPAISVSISPRAGVLPLEQKSFTVRADLLSNVEGEASGTVRLHLPEGWRSEPETATFSAKKSGEKQSIPFTVFPANIAEKQYQITAAADYNGKSYTEGYTIVGYSGLRPYFLYKPAVYSITGTNVRIAPNQNIGYIEGSGDDVPQALESLGVQVHFLSAQDLASADLSKFDVILLGVRAYAVRPDLIANNGRLLKYVENGGVAIVQYNTPEYDHNYGPYPYSMTSDPEEVTDEESVVEILKPENPVFNWPNKITSKDFEGWVEERGSKFISSWDPQYQALLETHDLEQEPQKGGLLYAKYGKGLYIYNAYAFYRELPEGVPGAYRIFANLLSLPTNPQARGDASK